ncbi:MULTISPECIES: sodium/proton antiporter NhaB [Alteromonas]|jgi:NhaB family Na+:H+ antiporter|uniref:sodium/proton antiporter NhaB n=1 Tax=Alteromonas TaxID=226 RepID=UPI00066ECAD9|nr:MULTISPECIES: sodium/proton antiporter NhaB [Alteromonas]MEC7282145.1 sodium/proton antiporter NhaB [Pseudomonadota bacterium]MCG7649049.1 sodium/proton antiporter NhaB [Alteromonas sp. MmMcT2-5]MDW5285540.1 sodium/proton antiporter NhaB [Alteromonas macleodii]MEC8966253.1 sodium/proton antiporter NhaB [Pseudomonadota bacterium]MED6322202.1 sodium/proton antiporter NhaB [Pseudomonadota bacterium]
MQTSMIAAIYKNFLGHAPDWYKKTIIAFLIVNPFIFMVDPYVAGWTLVIQFIFTLAMALKCYPLQPGGLLLIEAMFIGMTSPGHMMHEIEVNLEVLLLLVFMVAGIYFMKDLLMYLFTKLVIKVRNKLILSLSFIFASAFLSAFLDALTVVAVIISVGLGFYSIYHKVASGKEFHSDHDHTSDDELGSHDLEDFRAFLRNLMMHSAVGTALGGVMTMVGEPQNLIIADKAGWDFVEFFIRMAPVTIPVFVFGLLTTVILEKTGMFSYGAKLPAAVRQILVDYNDHMDKGRSKRETAKLIVQALIGVWLIIGLATHMASVGLIGLSVIVLATSMSGVIEEHALGKAFEEALPFTALLCVFFGVVAVIIDQGLFQPVIHWVLSFEGETQMVMFYLANGVLSMVSDNVFVGSVYITEVTAALQAGQITRDQYDMLAVAINTGTNLPSVATPNGQAAFLFLLTSAIAPLLRLSYGRMVMMALPYTIVLTIVGLLATYIGLADATQVLYDMHLIEHHSAAEAGAQAVGH